MRIDHLLKENASKREEILKYFDIEGEIIDDYYPGKIRIKGNVTSKRGVRFDKIPVDLNYIEGKLT